MRFYLSLLILILLFAACEGEKGYLNIYTKYPFYVLETVPHANELNVAIDTTIYFGFNGYPKIPQPFLDYVTITPEVPLRIRPVFGIGIEFYPDSGFAPNTTYTVILNRALTNSLGINMDEDFVLTFTTGPSK